MLPRLAQRTASPSLLLIYRIICDGCRQATPPSHRFRRTCPPSTALKQPSPGIVRP
ncbi:hypothetical protein ILYODFUR_034506, partial [Ilyodon furcidens]